jgi:hypothetical protein
MFTGNILTAEEISDFINSPENAIILQHDAHQDYDKRLAWGIEAVSVSGVVSLLSLSFVVRHTSVFNCLRITTMPVSFAHTALDLSHSP